MSHLVQWLMKHGGIYSITHTASGRQYIGSAVSFYNRWKEHRSLLNRGAHHSRHMQRTWNKYGKDAFCFAVIEVVEDKTLLLSREQSYLDNLRPEFNGSPTAGSQLGRVVTAETRAKRSAAMKGRVFSDEHRAKLSAAAKNMSPEHRTKLSEAAYKRLLDAEYREDILAKLLAGRLRYNDTPESKDVYSQAGKVGTTKQKALRKQLEGG